jgi:CMP-N,N'-diacetyllegionaminic acid synthase
MPRVLGVIPARGGSKRVPRKNLRELCGKPLIQYTIDAAHAATKLTTLVVSTEDCEIGAKAVALGAYVVRRPDDLAGDDITTGAVLKHALEWMETDTEPYDMVVCLHPTSPIRDPQDIDTAVDWLHATQMYDCLASCCPLPRKSHANVYAGHQMYGEAYLLNASIYAVKRDWLVKTGKHVSLDPMLLPMDRRHSLDIDEEIDFQIAELFLNGNT